MFCKWCGGTLTPSDVKCSRCGKAVPPLSDCGGFYDLMPTAESRKEAAPVPKMETKKATVPAQKEAQIPKLVKMNPNHGYIYITLLGFAVIIALVIVLFSRINQYSKVIDELKDELNSVSEELSNKGEDTNAGESNSLVKDPLKNTSPSESEKIDASEPPAITSASESTENATTDPTSEEYATTEALSREEIFDLIPQTKMSFVLNLSDEENGTITTNDIDLGKLNDSVNVSCGFDKIRKEYICRFKGEQFSERDVFRFKIGRSIEDGKASVSIDFNYETDFLGAPKSAATYTWNLQIAGKTVDVPIDARTDNGGLKAQIIDLDLDDLLEHGEKESIEIQCALTRETQKGCLTVMIQGITLSLGDFDN